MIRRFSIVSLILLTFALSGRAMATRRLPGIQASPAPRDPALEGAEALVGRALFLRGFYGGNDLTYDVLGHVKGDPKLVDWTLAGVDVQKVTRRGAGVGAGELELDGLRVAMRYNPEQHIFERHPQKDEKLRIVLAVNAEARGLQGALATIFAVGIDPALQRSMPAYWRHYFSPQLKWPDDDLTGQTIIPSNAPAGGLEFPVAEKRPEPDFTSQARLDKVKGLVQMRVTVGTDGQPRRIAIRQPLGYGLDAKTAENLAKYRFRPGMRDGKPVAVEVIVNQLYDVYPGPGR